MSSHAVLCCFDSPLKLYIKSLESTLNLILRRVGTLCVYTYLGPCLLAAKVLLFSTVLYGLTPACLNGGTVQTIYTAKNCWLVCFRKLSKENFESEVVEFYV